MTAEFGSRRRRLVATLGDGAVLVLPGAAAHDNFRQDANFWYLTGFEEPDAVLVLSDDAFILFVHPRDETAELWNGVRIGPDGARELYEADEAYPISEFDDHLRSVFANAASVWYPLGSRLDNNVLSLVPAARSMQRGGIEAAVSINDPTSVLAEMRVRKSPSEIALLRQACQISAEGHRAAVLAARPGGYEYEVQAAIEAVFRGLGARGPSFETIVGSGENACVLHYVSNSRQMSAGDSVCVDAGADFGYMCGDITRTFPLSGSFSPAQADVHEVVSAAHRACISMIAPGVSFEDITNCARRELTEGLVALDVLPLGVDQSLEMSHDEKHFPHGIGHFLGIEVHDVGAIATSDGSRVLEPGMVITIEPGLYFPPERKDVSYPLLTVDRRARAKRRVLLGSKATSVEEEELAGVEKRMYKVPDGLRGIGVRIEDDILVTSDGHEVLSG